MCRLAIPYVFLILIAWSWDYFGCTCDCRSSKVIQGVQILDVACGVGNVLTNKGAVMVNLRIADKTLCLVNAHMAAHQTKVRQRWSSVS